MLIVRDLSQAQSPGGVSTLLFIPRGAHASRGENTLETLIRQIMHHDVKFQEINLKAREDTEDGRNKQNTTHDG